MPTKCCPTEEKKNVKKECPKSVQKAKEDETSLFEVITYVIALFLVCSYGGYLYDKSAFETYPMLHPLRSFFEKVEEFSPFMEFLEDDNWATEERKTEQPSTKERILTQEELEKYDGSKGSKGIYIAILGQVFDVSKAPNFYGPNGGYGFFAGKDASRAYVTGNFDAEGLIDDVSGLSSSDYIGLDEWISFYHTDYEYVGKLAGRYFNHDGTPTKDYRNLQNWMTEAKEDASQKENLKQIFPPCNSEWSADKGQRVWCTKKSGGISRHWIGVPRRLFMPGTPERCACVKDSGHSLFNPDAPDNDRGDLDNPHLKVYDQCSDEKATSCQIKDS